MKPIKSLWFRFALILSVLFCVFFLLRFLNIDFSNISEEEFRRHVESLGAWGPVVYIAVYLLRPLIFFPAGVLSAAAGVVWGAALGFLYVQIAANISSTVEFFLARYFARELLRKYFKGRIARLDEKIEKHGFLTVFLIRLIPNVAWDIQNLSLGLTRVKFRDYFFATLLGIMPVSFAFVFFGSSLIKVLFNPKNFWVIGVAILLFAGVFYLQKYLQKKKLKNKI